jgi:glycosyltransferase involved in cell wall biosynthesis
MSDAFVSAAFFEGGPLTLMEAVRANLPVVMTRVGLAGHVQGVPGFEVVDPPIDMVEFRGRIWELASTPEFEQRFGAALARTYRERRRPDVAPALRAAMDKRHAYHQFVDVIQDVAGGRAVSRDLEAASWTARLRHEMLDGTITR